ncbi:MAG: hypothetical protein A2043_05505 [Candidatus Schekmanbacteria bacterium GWA2_38_9]|uniref:Uncharacterized protein n=1 Tax=Candidatus Schekmanbacteria bacterium RIFCSPLOWO2_12_FULL_38_15 TaxID=1817883 RepID=A0A1F7SQK3_9BACT|nr:MAG: hypothetical protein A2043_05505 [Candidatus Schekmanbacteria bacterium GWA2_38_9]OGL50205.1 MAG: hypothetical protein A3H37_00400 [Candidatus Schekmanbacteria bacterium RIFCSPLOWO2_02_FULL_38_14]OGL55484.1 MAG: hypothetical protein A3G31_01600 [Candidatus Schekmanbacteria bacterium RIFCSPLOWO2_12_FULL_38_15]
MSEIGEMHDEWLSIDTIGFHGRWICSPNQRWLLTHGQIHDSNAGSWSSNNPTDAVLLFDHDKQVCRLDGLSRPETVAICDAGVFAVYEWGPSSEFLGPRCRLRVFTPEERCVLQHRAGAAVELPTLSADGRYLAFHTLTAPHESPRPEDGESVFLVDLHDSVILWKQSVPVVWPKRITFDEASRHVVVHGESEDIFRYTYDGEFLDAEALGRASMRRALSDEYGYQLFDLARSRLDNKLSGDCCAEAIAEIEEWIRKALEKKMSPNTKASAHRILGEIAERRGDVRAALAEYLAAMELNPKIGLKKKVKALEAAIDAKGT